MSITTRIPISSNIFAVYIAHGLTSEHHNFYSRCDPHNDPQNGLSPLMRIRGSTMTRDVRCGHENPLFPSSMRSVCSQLTSIMWVTSLLSDNRLLANFMDDQLKTCSGGIAYGSKQHHTVRTCCRVKINLTNGYALADTRDQGVLVGPLHVGVAVQKVLSSIQQSRLGLPRYVETTACRSPRRSG